MQKLSFISCSTKQPKNLWKLLIVMFFFIIPSATLLINFNDFMISNENFIDLKKINYCHNIIFIYTVTGIFGGVIGHIIGHKRSVIIGMTYSFIALNTLTYNNLALIGFSSYLVGLGLILPNLFNMLGTLYNQKDSRALPGFIYTCFTVGFSAFIGIIITILITPTNDAYKLLFTSISLLIIFSLVGSITSDNNFNASSLKNNSLLNNFYFSNYTIFFCLIILSLLTNYFILLPILSKVIIIIVTFIFCMLIILMQKKSSAKKFFVIFFVVLSPFLFFLFVTNSIIFIFFNYSHFFIEILYPQPLSMLITSLVFITIFTILISIYIKKNSMKKNNFWGLTLSFLGIALSSLLLCIIFTLEYFILSGTLSKYLLMILITVYSFSQIVIMSYYYSIVKLLFYNFYESIIMGFLFLVNSTMGVIAVFIQKIVTTVNFVNTYNNLVLFWGIIFILAFIVSLLAPFTFKYYKN